MLKHKLIYLIYFQFFLIFCINGQSVKISGYIVDKENNKAIPFVSVYEVSNKKGISTDEKGFFELTLKKTDAVLIEISHLLYHKSSYRLNISKDTIITFVLKQKAVALNELVVVENSKIKNTSSTNYKNTQIIKMPALGGEKDVLKALQFSPGVQAGNEGTIGLNVRGGGQDQNLYLIDNMPI